LKSILDDILEFSRIFKGKIHFDNIITEALVKGLPVVEYSDNTAAKEIKDIWQKIKTIVE
ncbi:unnamed protein product, partial [marine sediment metagenome]